MLSWESVLPPVDAVMKMEFPIKLSCEEPGDYTKAHKQMIEEK